MVVFLFGYLALAIAIGAAVAKAGQRRVRWTGVVLAGCLPGLLWLAMSVHDALRSGRPVLDLVSKSGRFAFYVGGGAVAWATPIWLLTGAAGVLIGKSRKEACSPSNTPGTVS